MGFPGECFLFRFATWCPPNSRMIASLKSWNHHERFQSWAWQSLCAETRLPSHRPASSESSVEYGAPAHQAKAQAMHTPRTLAPEYCSTPGYLAWHGKRATSPPLLQKRGGEKIQVAQKETNGGCSYTF
eukprot:300820-Rhodomonas_salina.1